MGAGQSSKASKVPSPEAVALALRIKDGEITGDLTLRCRREGDRRGAQGQFDDHKGPAFADAMGQ